MPTQRVTVTTTTTGSTSGLVVNTGYLFRNKFGILKTLIFTLSLVIFVLMMMSRYKYENRFFFLIMVNFCHVYIVGLMLGCCVFSFSTATLLPKTTFDFVFHFMAFVLYLIAGLWLVIHDLKYEPTFIQVVGALTLVVCCLHLAHGVLSYRQGLN